MQGRSKVRSRGDNHGDISDFEKLNTKPESGFWLVVVFFSREG